jgi:hypothetical protein
LFNKFGPCTNGSERSFESLLNIIQEKNKDQPAIVISHDIRNAHWDGVCIQLLNWYIDSFISERICCDFKIQVIIFFLIKKFPVKLVDKIKDQWKLKRIIKAMEKKVGNENSFCSCSIISELKNFDIGCIEDWLKENFPNDSYSTSEKAEIFESIYKKKGREVRDIDMETVEIELERFYKKKVGKLW